MDRPGIDLIGVSLDLPKEILQLGKKIDRAISRTLGRAGDLVVKDLRDVAEFSRYTGRFAKQLKRSKVLRIGTRKYVDVRVEGDREKVARFLEWGTGGGTHSMKVLRELELWMNKKKIGSGLPKRERRAILFYIWLKVSEKGIKDRHYFKKARNLVEPKVQAMFSEMIKRLLSDLQKEGVLDGSGD